MDQRSSSPRCITVTLLVSPLLLPPSPPPLPSGLTITKLYFSPLIFAMYLSGLIAGGVYSIPPFYFKRFPLIAGEE